MIAIFHPEKAFFVYKIITHFPEDLTLPEAFPRNSPPFSKARPWENTRKDLEKGYRTQISLRSPLLPLLHLPSPGGRRGPAEHQP